jgi:hypothetical protein
MGGDVVKRRVLNRRYGRATGNYSGDVMPSWVKEGVRVKVKSTPITRQYGLSQGLGDKVWPGDVGTIRERQGNGWWDYDVLFERGDFRSDVRIVLGADSLERLSRLPARRGS